MQITWRVKSSLLILLPIISFNVGKRCIAIKSNSIALNATATGIHPEYLLIFPHTGRHSLSFHKYETLLMEMWGHGEHHLASMLPATVLRKFPCLCLNCRLRTDRSA